MAETGVPPGENTNNQQPGQVIKPGQTGGSPSANVPPPQPPEAEPQTDEASFKFSPDEKQAGPEEPKQPITPVDVGAGVSWTASEFIVHEKSVGWYGGLMAVTLIIIVAVYLLTRDKVSAGVVLVCAFALAALAGRKPHQVQYIVDGSGITVGQNHFEYGLFKSFAIVPEGAFSSIVLMPLKRFAPLTTIYYAPEDEEKIINVLSNRLPLQEHKLDAVDSLMRRIRL